MHRRKFLSALAAAAAAGLPIAGKRALAAESGASIYDLKPFGNVALLHITDCHAQLRPVLYREPSVNIGIGEGRGRPPHLVGEHLLRAFGIKPASIESYAFSHLAFDQAARAYGKLGGFAHIATLVKRLKASRPGALLLDGGDTWQGSATSLWTRGQDMVDAALKLGVDVMTGHWEFTYGAERVKELVQGPMAKKIAFVAQNIRTTDFEDRVFDPYVMRNVNGVSVAIIGQAFPYTPIANPRHLIPEWTFGIQEISLQRTVEEVRAKGAQVVVLLSHNGMDVDLKLASRITGIDVILGGHTHDAVPQAIEIGNANGITWVTNAGSNGKFVGLMEFNVTGGQIHGARYRLLPVFSNLLPPDPAMDKLIATLREPFAEQLSEPLGVTEGMLYRRGNFNGTFDQLILDALMDMKGAQIAFSPGFRWGTTMLPNTTIRREDLMDQTAITYPYVTVSDMTGATIKTILEDVCDNLFHPDPYYRQGGDMVRVGGLTYACAPNATIGKRISDLRLNGEPLDADKNYRVAGWAPVAADASGEPVWELVEQWIRLRGKIAPRQPNTPRLIGVEFNPGIG